MEEETKRRLDTVQINVLDNGYVISSDWSGGCDLDRRFIAASIDEAISQVKEILQEGVEANG